MRSNHNNKGYLGLSLVETVVVLAIISTVIGGIWVVASTVRQGQRINATALGILQIGLLAKESFAPEAYPTTDTTEYNVMSAAYSSGIIPKDFRYTSGAVAYSPMNAPFTLYLSCWGTYLSYFCPAIKVSFYGKNSSYSSSLSVSDCIQLVGKFATLSPSRNGMLSSVQFLNAGGPYLQLYPPFNTSQIDCRSDFTYVNFWFKP